MGKKHESQFSLHLPSPPVSQASQPAAEDKTRTAEGTVYSFTEKKIAKDHGEMARYFREIIQMARHFK